MIYSVTLSLGGFLPVTFLNKLLSFLVWIVDLTVKPLLLNSFFIINLRFAVVAAFFDTLANSNSINLTYIKQFCLYGE